MQQTEGEEVKSRIRWLDSVDEIIRERGLNLGLGKRLYKEEMRRGLFAGGEASEK